MVSWVVDQKERNTLNKRARRKFENFVRKELEISSKKSKWSKAVVGRREGGRGSREEGRGRRRKEWKGRREEGGGRREEEGGGRKESKNVLKKYLSFRGVCGFT